MYREIKRLLTFLIPRKLLFRLEPVFRSVYAIAFWGSRYRCNICNTGLRRFITLENGDQLCPRCGSIARNRRLWQLLQDGLLRPEIRILDFSPSRCLYRAMKAQKGLTYLSTDISGDFLADKQYDITAIEAPNDHFDLILCYHILEHIEADRQAMRELARILKPGGICLVQTPFKAGEIYEDPEIRDPAERLVHFGQEDHVRIYSVEGLRRRLEDSGFVVTVKKIGTDSTVKNGFATAETVLWLTPLIAGKK